MAASLRLDRRFPRHCVCFSPAGERLKRGHHVPFVQLTSLLWSDASILITRGGRTWSSLDPLKQPDCARQPARTRQLVGDGEAKPSRQA